MAQHYLIAAALTGAHNNRLGHALVPDAGHHSLHFLAITDLEGMIFECVERGQLDIDALFVLGQAGLNGGRGVCLGVSTLPGAGCTRARPASDPVASVTIFPLSAAIRISSSYFYGMKKGLTVSS